jgi:hypothetical protein
MTSEQFEAIIKKLDAIEKNTHDTARNTSSTEFNTEDLSHLEKIEKLLEKLIALKGR